MKRRAPPASPEAFARLRCRLTTFSPPRRPLCSVKNIDLCDDEKKAQIEKYQGMSVDDLKAEVEKEEGKIEDAEATFEAEVQKLQEKYEQLSKEREDAVAAVKAGGLGLMKSVMKSKEAPEAKDEL